MKKTLILKFGTAAITLADGNINQPLLQNICAQISSLQQQYHILVVSSGAVGCGKPFISQYKATINQKKAAAAIGNPLLMAEYARHFGAFGVHTAQCLLERSHFNHRGHFVQLKATITELWKNDIIPIANDNDVVNDLELRFSDNDELATLLAVAFDAEMLLIGSSVDGLLDNNGGMIAEVSDLDEAIFALVKPQKSAQGLGGMQSKLSHTKKATSLGIPTVIFNAKLPGNIQKAINKQTGTRFLASNSTLNARQKWLSSGQTHACIKVDDGAVQALVKRKSLLSVGLIDVIQPFIAGEMITICAPDNQVIAIAKSRINSQMIDATVENQVVAHANDILLT